MDYGDFCVFTGGFHRKGGRLGVVRCCPRMSGKREVFSLNPELSIEEKGWSVKGKKEVNKKLEGNNKEMAKQLGEGDLVSTD